MFGAGDLTYSFDGRAYDTEHAAVGGKEGQVLLLDGAQCLGGCGVASKDDERTTQGKEFLDCLQGKLVNDVEGACAVGRACIVAKIDIVVLWQTVADAFEYGQSSVAIFKNSDGSHVVSCLLSVVFCCGVSRSVVT